LVNQGIPLWRCHKEVRAFKIGEIRLPLAPTFKRPICRGSAAFQTNCGDCERCDYEASGKKGILLIPSEGAIAPFTVSGDYIMRHNPQVGGYFVLYEDDYQSYSPAAAFESGYNRVLTAQK
jgi:hypothetical protein